MSPTIAINIAKDKAKMSIIEAKIKEIFILEQKNKANFEVHQEKYLNKMGSPQKLR